MSFFDLLEKGYEIVGTTNFADDDAEMANDYKRSHLDVKFGRYKRSVGEEDAYAVVCKDLRLEVEG